MNDFVRGLFVSLSLLALGGCPPPGPAETHQKVRARQESFIRQITYVRDDRAKPPVCIGYFWEDRGMLDNATGGPAAFTVPCEAVDHLLVNKK